jgi:hypothetical protein
MSTQGSPAIGPAESTARRRCRRRARPTCQRWSMDFQHDLPAAGQRLRTLNIVDDFSREYPSIEVDTSLPGAGVVRSWSAWPRPAGTARDHPGQQPRDDRQGARPVGLAQRRTAPLHRPRRVGHGTISAVYRVTLEEVLPASSIERTTMTTTELRATVGGCSRGCGRCAACSSHSARWLCWSCARPERFDRASRFATSRER